MIPGHVGRIELRQDSNLLDDIFNLIFGILDVDDFDRNRCSVTFIDP